MEKTRPPESEPRVLEPVMVSILNDYLFCPRRAALKLIEGYREENVYTIAGSLAHEKIDVAGYENRVGVRVVRALPLFCKRLGLVGKADIVEFHPQREASRGEIPCPVEYKRGPRRKWDNDDVQVCAQALCLDEMLDVTVPLGAVYHAASRRRREIPMTDALRRQTEETLVAVRALIRNGVVPPASPHPKCEGCSLRAPCLPELGCGRPAVPAYLEGLFSR